MGSCVSSHLRKAPAPASTIDDVPSPVKDSAVNGADVLVSRLSASQSKPAVRDYGSKDDVFFDSKAWLDSDCEDDFFSVNGDFTPSRGNTPVHPSFMGTPQVRKTPTITTDKAPASVPEPSPNTKKKRLAELFRDSFGGSEEAPVAAADGDESKASPDKRTSKPPKPSSTTILDVLLGSEHGTPYISGANSLCNSERLPNEPDHKQKLGRPVQHRCLPSLMSCRISVDRKKKMAPAIPVYD